MTPRRVVATLVVAASAGLAAPEGAVEFSDRELRAILRHSPLEVPPDTSNAFAGNERAARLGQFLFFDRRLSANGAVACATCHDPGNAFTDGRPVSEGVGTGQRNTPALWNVACNRWYFWDGRADSLWSQALQPIENETELGSSRLELAHLMHDDARLHRAYEAIFGPLPQLADVQRFPPAGRPVPRDPRHAHNIAWESMAPADREAVNRVFVNVAKAIAAYERRLVSRRAPFDVFVEGLREHDPEKQAVLPADARRGLKLFLGRGQCFLCHSGPHFSDGEFHNIRVPPRGGGTPRDPGRFAGLREARRGPFNAAGAYSDDPDSRRAKLVEFAADSPQTWGAFKTPSLRNVELTAPYMHQGQFASLEDVLEYYSTLRGAVTLDHHDETILVPRNFSQREKKDLLAFLESLTDTALDPDLLRPPESP